jgi:hypothetical protein
VFHIIEEYNSPAIPFVVMHISMIALFSRKTDEPADQEVVNRIYLEDAELAENPIEVKFQGHTRMRLISEIQGIVVDKPGLLRFSILQGDNELASWKIPVRYIGRPEAQLEMPLPPSLETTG